MRTARLLSVVVIPVLFLLSPVQEAQAQCGVWNTAGDTWTIALPNVVTGSPTAVEFIIHNKDAALTGTYTMSVETQVLMSPVPQPCPVATATLSVGPATPPVTCTANTILPGDTHVFFIAPTVGAVTVIRLSYAGTTIAPVVDMEMSTLNGAFMPVETIHYVPVRDSCR